jgi:hypothetical protein
LCRGIIASFSSIVTFFQKFRTETWPSALLLSEIVGSSTEE